MSCNKCFKQVTFRDEQNPNTPNLMFAQKAYDVNVSPHADYVMFNQSVDQQQNEVLSNLLRRVGQNERNLIQVGKDATKIGQDTTALGSKQAEIDARQRNLLLPSVNILNRNSARLADIEKNKGDLQRQLNDAKTHRDSIEGKIDSHTGIGHAISGAGGILGGLGVGSLVTLGIVAFLLFRGGKL